MVKIREDFKFKKIKNFFNQDELKFLTTYIDIKNRISFDNFDQAKDWGQGFYGDPIMESMLLNKKDLMSKECGLELLPTYSFWRLYTKYQYLPKHKDRPSCEISVTACIMNDGTEWPIYVDGNPVVLNPGDACIYLGCESLHWREEFQGDHNAQVFLHYVDKNGPKSEFYLDKRVFWGTQAV
jgi:hypothetical protein